jgi:hypothetical protein
LYFFWLSFELEVVIYCLADYHVFSGSNFLIFLSRNIFLTMGLNKLPYFLDFKQLMIINF